MKAEIVFGRGLGYGLTSHIPVFVKQPRVPDLMVPPETPETLEELRGNPPHMAFWMVYERDGWDFNATFKIGTNGATKDLDTAVVRPYGLANLIKDAKRLLQNKFPHGFERRTNGSEPMNQPVPPPPTAKTKRIKKHAEPNEGKREQIPSLSAEQWAG